MDTQRELELLRKIERLGNERAELLAELKAIHEKTGWQSTADLLAKIEEQ